MPRQLTVDLGFNFDAQPFGTPLGRSPDEFYYPLQMGMNDTDDNPVLPTALSYADQIRFKASDITHSSTATPTDVASTSGSNRTVETVAVAFVNSDAVSSSRPWPFTGSGSKPAGVYRDSVSKDAGEAGLVFESDYLYVDPDDTNSAVYCQENPNWSLNRWHCLASVGETSASFFTLVSNSLFIKSSFLVRVSDGSTTKDFILDPEWYVGPHGG